MKVNFLHPDIRKFVNNLDDNSYAETIKALELLAERGHEIRMPFSKKINKNIYELRIKSIQNVRIFYTFRYDEIFLLHAILKKTQRLSSKDLSLAINRERRLR